MSKVYKTCGTCAHRQPQTQNCPLLKRETADADSCPFHTSQLTKCSKCGVTIIRNSEIFYCGEHTLCLRCQSQHGYCETCRNASTCSFETDPSPIPKVITQQIQQGPMIIQQQIRNPERIKITCANNCKCYDSELGCLKENRCCGNWEFC